MYFAEMVGLFLSLLFVMSSEGCVQNNELDINITLIENAKTKGTVCLDGSSGGYYFSKGFGDGFNNWMVYLPGGAWCFYGEDCFNRSQGIHGSTKFSTNYTFKGILSPNRNVNPDFYNWNKVAIHYCDGASFIADAEAVVAFNGANLYRRGRRIFTAVIEELLADKGMKNATNGVLVGSSAGGMAAILHCDRFQSYFNKHVRLKCISDAGFFIHAKDLPDAAGYRENSRASLAKFHDLARVLPKTCTSRRTASLCLFPEYIVGDVKTPLFILNSEFDQNQFQISFSVSPHHGDDQGWLTCIWSIEKCTPNELRVIKDFGTAFVNTIEGLDENDSRGYFITSCYIHSFLVVVGIWPGTPTLQNETIAQAIGDWYLDRREVKLMDAKTKYPLSNCSAVKNINYEF